MFLATEQCRPLMTVLSSLSDVEVCLGLKSILGAMIFLVEQAKTRHLNIAISSIYVNPEGQWKLFGFEHLWKSSELTESIFEKSKSHRYEKARDADEAIEQFAFAVLCEDVLKERKETPHTDDFKEYCTTHLKHAEVEMRPTLQAILLHPYFNHNFVQIHSYLLELPLKSALSKQEFFTNLTERLKEFDESIVGAQLTNLLLSRMVLLDPTAKNCFIPNFLRPRTENFDAILGLESFKKYLIPRIKALFQEKDAQIRISLLEFFPSYVELFTKEDLAEILPQLLLGLKDTNDFLVSRTLYCMADLVPILGATAVVGSDRTRIFSDGRPQGPDTDTKYQEPRSITPVLTSANSTLTTEGLLLDAVDVSGSFDIKMPERLSPDGEEIPTASEIEVDEWSDWDGEQKPEPVVSEVTPEVIPSEILPKATSELIKPKTSTVDALDELDIKSLKVVAKPHESSEEFDYFKDMEPVIQATKLVVMETATSNSMDPTVASSTRLNVNASTADHGWDTDDNWGE